MSWHQHAACTGTDSNLWFPQCGEDVRTAKEICSGCPVRQKCLDDALERGEKFGIWGGLSERERRRVRSTRRTAA